MPDETIAEDKAPGDIKSSKDWPKLEKEDKKPPKDKPPTKKPPGRRRSRKDRLHEFIAQIGAMVLIFSAEDGEVILEQAGDMAAAWDKLAGQNARVADSIERVLTGGAWGGVVMVHFGVAFRIAQNHGIAPELTFMPQAEENGRPGEAPSPDTPVM